MTSLRTRQTGATPAMMLVWLLILVSVATLAIKHVPIYIDDFAVQGALDGLKREPRLAEFSDEEIRKLIGRHLDVNNVRNFDRENNILIEEAENGGVTVRIKYEVRTPIVHNIDTVVSFDHSHTAAATTK